MAVNAVFGMSGVIDNICMISDNYELLILLPPLNIPRPRDTIHPERTPSTHDRCRRGRLDGSGRGGESKFLSVGSTFIPGSDG